jgi:hypothetical protein
VGSASVWRDSNKTNKNNVTKLHQASNYLTSFELFDLSLFPVPSAVGIATEKGTGQRRPNLRPWTWRSANKPDYVTRLEDALTKYPSLREQFEDVFVESMGFNPHPPPGVTSTGLTPAGVNAARDLLQPRGMLRILQEPTAGQSLPQLESDLRIMLSGEFIIVNVQQHTDPKSGVVHLLVAARKKWGGPRVARFLSIPMRCRQGNR